MLIIVIPSIVAISIAMNQILPYSNAKVLHEIKDWEHMYMCFNIFLSNVSLLSAYLRIYTLLMRKLV